MKKKICQLIKSFQKKFIIFLLMVPGFFVFFPVMILITGSVMDQYELKEYLNPVFTGISEFISWKLIPDYPSFKNYGKLLFMTPQFVVY